jgi:hypothetical protein
MNYSNATDSARREFLKFLAASPYVAALGGVAAYLERNVLAQNTQESTDVITDPAKALNVFDFEEPARRKVMQGHWAYMASGVDDDGTLRANREAFKHIELRPRRLHDATKVDTHVELFGTTYNSPIYFCPTGGEKSFFPEGELAVARSAKAHGTLQVLSTATSTPVEDVVKTLGRPVWQQLYAPTSWDACEKILRRVEAAGVTVLALTVDNTTGRNSETYLRNRGKDLRVCLNCHESDAGPSVSERPMYDGIDMTGVRTTNPTMDWAYLDRLRKTWKGNSLSREWILATMRGCASNTVSTPSWCQTMAAAPRKLCARLLRRCPKSSPKSAAACRSLSTAAFAAAPMYSRHSRSELKPSASGVPSCGDWAPSAKPASIA